jgi:hypothetical protein
MYFRSPRLFLRRLGTSRGCILLVLSLGLLSSQPIAAQEESVRPLRLEAITVTGLHSVLTESWVTLEVTLANPNETGRDARVAVFYTNHPDLQYVRDVWIPPQSLLMTWMLVGPVPEGRPSADQTAQAYGRELQALIYDRTGNQERLLLPRTEERVRSRLANYRPREPLTCLLTDDIGSDDESDRFPPSPDRGESDEVLDLVRAFRASYSLSQNVRVIDDNFLPPTAAAFDGVDHFVLAGRRLALDPPGQVALRHWLEQGGKLWVMLDRTDPDVVARILGGSAGFHVVDRTGLTSVQFEGRGTALPGVDNTARDFEEPVDFVRVKVGPNFTVLHTVDGWPASFTRPVGQGRVVITTLGARAWGRPRDRTDTKSPFLDFPDIPVTLPVMDMWMQELQSAPGPAFPSTSPEAKDMFAPLVTGDIGYSVVGIGTASLVFGGFLLALVLFGLGLRKWRRSELLGWLGPVTALSTASAFWAVGEAGRRSVPATVAVAEMVAVNPHASEQAVTGLLGFYRPDSGSTGLSSKQGGLIDLDMTGLEGQNKRLVLSDIDAWHWEKLSLPAAVRLGPFRSEVRQVEPMAAVARFGPEGLQGKISSGPFQNLADALIYSPSHRAFAVHLGPDGTFTAAGSDLLSSGQFVAGTVLSDQQQRRQRVYQRLLGEAKAKATSEDSLILAWADPIPLPFTFESGVRSVGSALLSIPLEIEHAPPNTRLTVPRAFIGYRRILPLGSTQPTLEGLLSIEQHLRFQLPSSVLPMQMERVRLFAKVDAPMRRFIVSGLTDGKAVELRSVQNPVDPISLEIEREDLLRLDEKGGFHLQIAVSDPEIIGEELPPHWSIQSLELEVVGQTDGANRK